MKTKTWKDKTWKDKIGKRLLNHLKENGCTTLTGFTRTFRWQVEHNLRCFSCDAAARKLGLTK